MFFRASLVAQLVKNPPGMQESPVLFLGLEDALEKGTATHSSILAWRIPQTEPSRLQSKGPQSQTRLSDFPSFRCCVLYQVLVSAYLFSALKFSLFLVLVP